MSEYGIVLDLKFNEPPGSTYTVDSSSYNNTILFSRVFASNTANQIIISSTEFYSPSTSLYVGSQEGNGLWCGSASADHFVLSGDFLVSAWCYLTGVPYNNFSSLASKVWTQGISTRSDPDISSFEFGVFKFGSDYRPVINVLNLTTNGTDFLNYQLSSTVAIALGTWVFLEYFRIGNTLFIAVNGVITASRSVAGYGIKSTSPLYVGANHYNESTRNARDCWFGYIDDFIFYNGTVGNNSISGTVYEKNEAGAFVPGAYPVRVYDRATGLLVAYTTSGIDGSYTIHRLSPTAEYYVMALDNSAPIQRSAIVDKVVPS